MLLAADKFLFDGNRKLIAKNCIQCDHSSARKMFKNAFGDEYQLEIVRLTFSSSSIAF